MNKSKYPPVLTIRYEKETNGYRVKFPDLPIESMWTLSLDATLDSTANSVRAYKDRNSHDSRIAEIDAEIRRLEIEREALVEAHDKDMPIYSLLDPADLAVYRIGISGLDIEKINWFENRYNATIIGINLIESPGGNRYGTPLTWQWVILKNKDDDDE